MNENGFYPATIPYRTNTGVVDIPMFYSDDLPSQRMISVADILEQRVLAWQAGEMIDVWLSPFYTGDAVKFSQNGIPTIQLDHFTNPSEEFTFHFEKQGGFNAKEIKYSPMFQTLARHPSCVPSEYARSPDLLEEYVDQLLTWGLKPELQSFFLERSLHPTARDDQFDQIYCRHIADPGFSLGLHVIGIHGSGCDYQEGTTFLPEGKISIRKSSPQELKNLAFDRDVPAAEWKKSINNLKGDFGFSSLYTKPFLYYNYAKRSIQERLRANR